MWLPWSEGVLVLVLVLTQALFSVCSAPRAAVPAELPADLQEGVDGHRQAEDGQVLPGEEKAWLDPARLLSETQALVSAAGSLHVQTNLPDAEEDQLGQQVPTVLAVRWAATAAPNACVCVCAQRRLQVPAAADGSAAAKRL